MPKAFCLSMHAAYGCRRAGKCCDGHWLVPVEPEVVRLVGARGLGRPEAGRQLFTSLSGADGRSLVVVGREPDGSCVFFERDAGRSCSIHREAGPEALPSACRHFPRVPLHDDRGTFIALSHFCPTAAALLFDLRPLSIVEAPASLQFDGIEGFEARGALPPLLRPGMLTDLDGYGAWESACIRTFAKSRRTADAALAVVQIATARIREWTPGHEPLAIRVRREFERAERESPAGSSSDEFTVATRNYLAAHVFGNRIAYEGQGLLTVVTWLATCLQALRREMDARRLGSHVLSREEFIEAVRAADKLLVHEMDTREFARQAAEPPAAMTA